jgi:predicted TPR repeat methyltransferase
MEEIASLYTRHAEQFDRARKRDLLEQPYLDAALEAMTPAGEALDLGCGAGEPIARYLVDRGHRVTGVDVAEPMIELCRSRFPEMTWLHRDMRALELRKRFNLIIAWDSFFHLDHADQRAMFPTFAQHGAVDSLLLFTSGVSKGVAIGELFGDELFHSSLDTQEYREWLEKFGYSVLIHRVEDPNCGSRTVWLARKEELD